MGVNGRHDDLTCVVNRKPYLYRCIPVDGAEKMATDFYSGSGMSDWFGDVIADLRASWQEIVYMALIGLGTRLIDLYVYFRKVINVLLLSRFIDNRDHFVPVFLRGDRLRVPRRDGLERFGGNGLSLVHLVQKGHLFRRTFFE